MHAHRHPSRWLGTGQALMSALLFGLAAPLSKHFLTGLPAIEASGLLYFSSGSLLGGWLLLRGGTREAPLRKADLPWLAGSVFFGGLLGAVLLLWGLARASGTVASLLLNLESVFTVLIALAFGESLGRRPALGIGLIVAGGLVLAIDPAQLGASSWLGALALAGACASWGLDNNLTQKLSGRDPVTLVAIKGLVAGAIALALAAATSAPWPARETLLAAIVLGGSGYGLSLLFFVLSLRQIGTARAGTLFATAPFAGALASWLLLGERPGPATLAAGAIMAVGVVLMATESHEHEHTHEPLDHDHLHVHDAHHQHEHTGDEGPEPHAHPHVHQPLTHAHAHQPDLHHRHEHD